MSSYYDSPSDVPSFIEIASYFGLCVWLVPFALFVSLSASDNILPTMDSEGPSMGGGMAGDGRAKRGQGLAKALVDNVRSGIGAVTSMAGWNKAPGRFE